MLPPRSQVSTVLPIEELRAASCPWPHYHEQSRPTLFISYTPAGALPSAFPGKPCWTIKDWAGYLTATDDPAVLAELCRIESYKAGAVRSLLEGPKIDEDTLFSLLGI